MIADIHITEKSFGDKTLMKDVKFSVDDGEKVGVVGRNGVGKSTLFGILSGKDTDYTGEVIFSARHYGYDYCSGASWIGRSNGYVVYSWRASRIFQAKENY